MSEDRLTSAGMPALTKKNGLEAKAANPLNLLLFLWRRDPESNRANRICNPVHNRFAIAPKSVF